MEEDKNKETTEDIVKTIKLEFDKKIQELEEKHKKEIEEQKRIITQLAQNYKTEKKSASEFEQIVEETRKKYNKLGGKK